MRPGNTAGKGPGSWREKWGNRDQSRRYDGPRIFPDNDTHPSRALRVGGQFEKWAPAEATSIAAVTGTE
ncbi:putative ligase [Streptomyces sp. NBRC 110611]|nr:putative ligase [Streptomyces sp. NBRC 110611]